MAEQETTQALQPVPAGVRNGFLLGVVRVTLMALALLASGAAGYAALHSQIQRNQSQIEAAQRERDALRREVVDRLERIETEQMEQRSDIKLLIREVRSR